ncbi:hypothetical protein [Pseudonocardia sp. EV170527-09]|nr:hypothetical protein [Pseudonocardia sp. EV170527-09]
MAALVVAALVVAALVVAALVVAVRPGDRARRGSRPYRPRHRRDPRQW